MKNPAIVNASGEGADKSLASTCFSTTSNCTQNDLEVAFLKSPEVVFLKSVNYDEFKGGDSPDKHRWVASILAFNNFAQPKLKNLAN